ncbi:CotH kinase protein [Phytophthora infestans]|uniref:CotH kinase protein n=1 Tax=Phytophthora infestans TaxID=4787 RepID=A0A833TCJ0_PHYIN|nr:CotH kinase protein [Phytophthora infestans]KAF4130737.1 CotH kinase protein [Phytophthora infestans]
MRIYSLLTLLASLQAALAQHQATPSQAECYEMPVVIVSALDRSFPDSTCNQLRYPADDCLKEAVQTRVEVIDNTDGKLNCINGERTAVFEHSKANYRGQSSLFFAKHQFNLKFPEDTSFLGMVENKAFVMNGPFLDCTLLRNHLAHWLYRSTGRYSVKTRHAVVYMRTNPTQEKPEYAGIFLLLEKPTYDKNHVNLASINATCAARNPKVLNGGWAWSNDPPSYGSYSPNMVIDQYQNEFGMGERPVLAYPSGSSLSQQMRDYFVSTDTGFLPQMYRVLWNNMTAPLELPKHLDLGSFADYLLHTEMSLNVDAYRRSTFFFKDRDQPINAGPVWDLNLAYGNGARRHFKDWIYPQYTYWKRLMCHSQLASLVIQRWKTLRGTNMQKADDPVFGAWRDDAITKFLDASAAPVYRQLSKCRGGDWRRDVVQCAVVDLETCNGTYAERVNEMRDAVLNRARWMDERIEQLYKPLDALTCSGVGNLPKFNCAVDGNDDGCLKNAEEYYNAVTFPPIRKPYTGPSCDEIVTLDADAPNGEEMVAQMTPYQKPSVDYCWQSAGSYVYPQQKVVKDKKLTPFCSGYGSCAQGPGATCNCSVALEVEHPSCRRIDAENEQYRRHQQRIADYGTAVKTLTTSTTVADTQTESSENGVGLKNHSPVSHAMAAVSAGVAGVVLLVLGTWLVKEHSRRRCRRQRLNEFIPVRYGSVEQARMFESQSAV